MKPLRIVTIVFGLLLVILLVVFFRPKKTAHPPSVSELGQSPGPPSKAEPVFRYPLPEAPPSTAGKDAPVIPLPALGESDPFTSDLLMQLFGESAWKQLLLSQHFIQRLVLIIDALPRKDLPMKHLPVRSPLGSFQTADKTGTEIIATENFSRYAPYVGLAEAVPPQRLAQVYLRIYPLLEEAYRDLGHPDAYFHDRMIEVLDHLLDTPQLQGPIPVVKHVTRYRYADPQLESLSSGQKILLRMGAENARRVENVLRQLRNLLVGIQEED